MNTGISAIALTLSLLGLSACSSADGDQPSADHTTASSTSSASDAAASAPAIRMRDSGGQWTSCVPYTRSEGDFVWTGARLTADADARLVDANPDQNGAVVVGAWVAEADHAAGAFVPWSKRHEFLRKMDWAHHQNVYGAQLTAGKKYSLVFRIRPKVSQLPAELRNLTVKWDADGTRGSLTDDSTVLQFKQHC